jgi:hypothetical protein
MLDADFVRGQHTMRTGLYTVSLGSEPGIFKVYLRAPKKSASEKTAMRRDVVSCTGRSESVPRPLKWLWGIAYHYC